MTFPVLPVSHSVRRGRLTIPSISPRETHFFWISLRRSVSANALFIEGVTRSAYRIARPASCLVALPIVCSNAVSLRRNPSASASRMQTRDTSGRLRPWTTQPGFESARQGGASRGCVCGEIPPPIASGSRICAVPTSCSTAVLLQKLLIFLCQLHLWRNETESKNKNGNRERPYKRVPRQAIASFRETTVERRGISYVPLSAS